MIRVGKPPFKECSTQGDRRFSAFCARIRGRRFWSIEDLYQAAKVFENGETNLGWKKAKGRKPINIKEVTTLYSQLWDEYMEENPELLVVLQEATGLSDVFGQPGCQCQVLELWRIRNK